MKMYDLGHGERRRRRMRMQLTSDPCWFILITPVFNFAHPEMGKIF